MKIELFKPVHPQIVSNNHRLLYYCIEKEILTPPFFGEFCGVCSCKAKFGIILTQDLLSKLKTGELSSIDTLHAYQWKAIQVNKKQNCIVQFIEDAEDEAKNCDKLTLQGNCTI